MQNLPEGLIYVLVLAVAYLATYLLKRFAPNLEQAPPQAELDAEPTAPEAVPVGLAAASIAAAAPLLAPRPSQPRGQLPRLAWLGSKRNKQAAIAMATILGPCRAFDADGDPASARR